MKRAGRTFPALLLLGALIGCDSSASAPSTAPATLRTTSVPIGSQTFTLEVADNNSTREHGLMQRDSMPADHGMIFVFSRDEPRGFWMKNTRFPLDILFVRSDGTIVSIHTMRAYDLTATNSAGPAKFAIELNQGAAARAGVKAGDKLQIPKDASEPAG
jgi:uncharacterized membrane protein (UPF0127 family)